MDRILCVSDFIRNEIMHRFCFKDETKLLTIHNSIKLAVRNRETPILPNGEIVLLEAMSIGGCVVASDVGGFTELIHDGENGFLFEADNVQELTRRLAYIFEHIEAANEMGKSAQSKVMEEYLWENTVKKICEIYEEINTTYNLCPKCSH